MQASSSRPMSHNNSFSSSRTMASDTFKPKFPLDPFADTQKPVASREPWTLDVDVLPPLALSRQQRNVIMVIGETPKPTLDPLFGSTHLASSLVIIATHKPPTLPSVVHPAVRILRLSAPLEVENTGASRLVDVLEWAERVGRTWRRHDDSGVQELYEANSKSKDSGQRPLSTTFRSSTTTLLSRRDTSTKKSGSTTPPTLKRTDSASSLKKPWPLSKTPSHPLPPADPTQRPFDAILNFLPSNIPDKLLLKHSILVTTISRAYLLADTPGFGAVFGRTHQNLNRPLKREASQRRWSFFSTPLSKSTDSQSLGRSFASRSNGRIDDVTTASAVSAVSLTDASTVDNHNNSSSYHSRIIHLLPSSLAKYTPPQASQAQKQAHAILIRSMEAFLLSFSSASSSQVSLSDTAKNLLPNPVASRIRPYILHAGNLADVIASSKSGDRKGEAWSLSDIVLCGYLDSRCGPDPPSRRPGGGVGKGKEMDLPLTPPRAWVGGVTDIVLSSTIGQSQTLPPSPPSPSPPTSPNTTTAYSIYNLYTNSQKRLASPEPSPAPVKPIPVKAAPYPPLPSETRRPSVTVALPTPRPTPSPRPSPASPASPAGARGTPSSLSPVSPASPPRLPSPSGSKTSTPKTITPIPSRMPSPLSPSSPSSASVEDSKMKPLPSTPAIGVPVTRTVTPVNRTHPPSAAKFITVQSLKGQGQGVARTKSQGKGGQKGPNRNGNLGHQQQHQRSGSQSSGHHYRSGSQSAHGHSSSNASNTGNTNGGTGNANGAGTNNAGIGRTKSLPRSPVSITTKQHGLPTPPDSDEASVEGDGLASSSRKTSPATSRQTSANTVPTVSTISPVSPGSGSTSSKVGRAGSYHYKKAVVASGGGGNGGVGAGGLGGTSPPRRRTSQRRGNVIEVAPVVGKRASLWKFFKKSGVKVHA